MRVHCEKGATTEGATTEGASPPPYSLTIVMRVWRALEVDYPWSTVNGSHTLWAAVTTFYSKRLSHPLQYIRIAHQVYCKHATSQRTSWQSSIVLSGSPSYSILSHRSRSTRGTLKGHRLRGRSTATRP